MAKIKIQFNANKIVEFDKRFINGFSSLSRQTSDGSTINYGSIESSGSLSIYDRNKTIRKLIDGGYIKENDTPISLFINDNNFQNHMSSDNIYNDNNNEFNVSLGNSISDWSILQYNGFKYQKKEETAYDVLFHIMNELYGNQWTDNSVFDSMLQNKIIWGSYNYYSTIKEYLQNIQLPVVSIDAGKTFRKVIDDFCSLVQLQVFIDDKGNVVFDSARPVTSSVIDEIIEIKESNIFSDFNRTVLPKNRYSELDLSAIYVNRETLSQTVVKSENIKGSLVSETNKENGPSYWGEVKTYYYTGTITINKYSDDNLQEVKSILNGVDEEGKPITLHSVNFEHETGTASFYGGVQIEGQDPILIPSYTTYEKGAGILANFGKITATLGERDIVSLDDKTNLKNLTITEYDDRFEVYYKVLVGWSKLTAFGSSTSDASGTAERYYPLSMDISILGTKFSISFKSINVSSDGVKTSKNKTSIATSQLFETDAYYSDKINFVEQFKRNILSDYADGIPTATVTVSCANYYAKNGSLVVDWNKGQIIKVGDLLCVPYSNKIWKVIGREVVYEGVPLLKLQLMEVKPVFVGLKAGLYDNNNSLKLTWPEVSEQFYFVNTNGSLSINGEYYKQNLDGRLYISSEVTELSDFVFQQATKLTFAFIPSSVKRVGKGALNASALTEVVLSEGVETIDRGAFLGTRLQDLTIPSTVTYIDANSVASTFPSITLKNISVSSNNKIYDSRYNCNAIIETATDTLITGCSETKIPEDIKIISPRAFTETVITNLELPDGLTTIGEEAFRSIYQYVDNVVYDHFKTVFIPKSVTSIGAKAFSRDLYSSAIDKDSMSITIYCEADSKPDGWDGDWNKYVYVDNSVSQINAYYNVVWGVSREDYPLLSKGFVVEDGVLTAYTGSDSEVVIPEGIVEIGGWAFNGDAITKIAFPNSLQIIGSGSFAECRQLTGDLIIPNSVTNIQDRAFANCVNINGILHIGDNVQSIGEYAFMECNSLQGDLIIPDSVTTIGDEAFSYCMGFTGYLYIGKNVTEIGEATFRGCWGLTGNVVVPDGVTIIQNSTFSSCKNITGISLPKNLQTIGELAFNNCKSISNIKIPKTVSIIGTGAFRAMGSIRVDFSEHQFVPTIGTEMFLESYPQIVVPDNLYDSWVVADGWSTYADYIYKASEV